MACTVQGGPRVFGLTRDKDGNRTYKVSHLVVGTDGVDGVASALTASGLPAIGSYWDFLSDIDIWAYCTPEATVRIHKDVIEGSNKAMFEVTQTFSTIPFKRCQDDSIEDPLAEPQKVSGGFNRTTTEASEDKDGNPLHTVSHETIKGPQVEFDDGNPTVRIEQNTALLGLEDFSGMIHTVNDSPLWGMAARCVKLSNITWQRLVYGTCDFYYKRIFDFEVNPNTFDRDILPMCNRVLKGYWSGTEPSATWILDGSPVLSDPNDFIRYKVKQSDEYAPVVLKADGTPWRGVGIDGAAPTKTVQKYEESDFTLLGIPLTF